MLRRNLLAGLKACATRRAALALLLAVVGLLGAADAQRAQESFDVLIAGGRIVDGSGSPWFAADVGIAGDRIRRIGDLSGATATRRIDARGLIVAPGFIDAHAHARERLFELPTADGYVRQGVTTVVDGNDGSSPLPLAPFFEKAAAARFATNLALFVGHGTVRERVMGTANKYAGPGELESMKALVADAMREGALGLSTGLAYVPGTYAGTDEVIALATVAGTHGGIYASHMRDEGGRVLDSVRETIRIGEEAHLPVHISHHKVGGRKQFGQSVQSLQLIAAARARGIDVTFDQYPYTASQTGLTLIFPPWAMADGSLSKRLSDPAGRAEVKSGMLAFIDERFGDDPSRIQLVRCGFDPSLSGKTIADLLKAARLPLTQSATADTIIDLQLKGGCSAIFHAYDEPDVVRLMQSPFGMIASDGSLTRLGDGSPHPRAFGTFPRVLGRYVREQHVLSLEEAVRKMTAFPAARLGLQDRGLLREGLSADITIFDSATIVDRATFTDPHQYSEGVRWVLVNGDVVIGAGTHTGTRPGRVLRRDATPTPTSAVQPSAPADEPLRPPTRADILRGEYGPYRANNDLLFYHLDVRVDPDAKSISGKNTIRFKMLEDATRIQLDLYANLNIDNILLATTLSERATPQPMERATPQPMEGATPQPMEGAAPQPMEGTAPQPMEGTALAVPLKYQRELNAVFVDFPTPLKAGSVHTIEFHYSGMPKEQGRFGGMAFRQDPAGRHWINTACEGEGSSIWWPSKDQWRDEPESMEISVAIPSDLVDVSNGRFLGKTDLGDGYTRWDWRVHYPINSYNVSLNIGPYVHFADRLGDLSMDFYVLPESLDKAKQQFAQAKPMLEGFEKYFGEYPFVKDGYKLIEVPYSGMEHQSAVTYGNRFANGYLERDWTGVGVSPKFDFIIVHESGHEWFGNAVSAADVADMWIHEGWTTYLEVVYVEHMFGYDDALKYVNGYKAKVLNREPIVTQRGIHRSPPADQYFKGALFLHTLRSIVNDDARWWKLVRDVYQRFKYQNIATEDIVRFFNQQLGQDLTPVFDQYLRRTALPMLELAFIESEGKLAYRWKTDERAFAMPIRVGIPGKWHTITPTTEWQRMPNTIPKDQFEVATDLYYVNVTKQ